MSRSAYCTNVRGAIRRRWRNTTRSRKGDELPDDVGLLSTVGAFICQAGAPHRRAGRPFAPRALSNKRYVSPCEIAPVQGALGDSDAAFRSLDQCYADRSWEITFLKLDPAFEELRSDPRYTAMIRKLRL